MTGRICTINTFNFSRNPTVYTLEAVGPGGTSTANVILEVQRAISLAITSPAPSITVNVPEISIKGFFDNPTGNETGIIADGIPAQLHGNEFFINSYQLDEGENTITVTALDTAGNSAQEVLTVFLDTSIFSDWLSLHVNPVAGLAPLKTTMRVENHLSFTPTGTPLIESTGPDIFEISWIDATEMELLFSTPGIYTLYYTIEDPAGNPIQQEVNVNVLDRAEIDALLQSKWAGMKNAMIEGDIEKAVSYFVEDRKDIFREIYTQAQSTLAEIAMGMQDIELVYLRNDTAKYRLRKDIIFKDEAVTVTFDVYFQRGRDGIWRIRDY